MQALPRFDHGALFTALDDRRREPGLHWYPLADEQWWPTAAFSHLARW
ncbi:hypothetical protein [Leekyejoonella antrihumi]|nr:hypothetical protein [Leekyejoonella antrihumi]